jgi:hypothetical protein
MTKITIPVDSAKNGGALYILVDDLSNLNSEVSKTRDNGILIIDDVNASPDQRLVIDEATILSILAETGDIEGYLFGIKQPSASATIDVPVGVPARTFILGAVKNFSQWFANNADVWLNNVTNEILYFNQPNPSDSIILKASEAELIRQIDTGTYSFLTVAEVEALIVNTDWVKL